MAENVTLEFLGRQFERLFTELAEMRSEQVSVREDMRALTAIVLRHDATLNGILEQLHAMTAQLNRLDIRRAGLRNNGRRAERALMTL